MSKPQCANQSRYNDLVYAIATGQSVAEYCRKSGTPERTCRSWQQEASFARDLNRVRRNFRDRTYGRLAADGEAAAAVMIAIAHDESVPPAIRLTAARSVVSDMARLEELTDVQARLAELERKDEEERNVP